MEIPFCPNSWINGNFFGRFREYGFTDGGTVPYVKLH